jgi:ParB-like chromosome segregation protein Spo0J
MDPNQYYIVGLDGPEDETHELYDERVNLPVSESLIRSLILYGNRVPIIVRETGDRVEVVDGRQRVRAARLANERLKAQGEPGVVLAHKLDTDANDAIMASSVMNLANAIRFADDPVTESEKTLRYVQRLRRKAENPIAVCKLVSTVELEHAANVFGCSPQTIKNRLKFSTLDPIVQNMVREGKLGFTHAFNLSELSRDEQIAKAKEIANESLTIEETKAKVKAFKRKEEVDQEKGSPVGVVLIRRIVALAKDDGKACRLDDKVLHTLRVVCGELPAVGLTGLPELINRVESGERPERGLKKKDKKND